MKYKITIKLRLALQFSLLVMVILLFFSFLLYYFSWSSQRNKFRENILNRAKNTAILLVSINEIDTAVLKKIHESTVSWKGEEILVTDSGLKKIYSFNNKSLTKEVAQLFLASDTRRFFRLGERDGVCYKYVKESQDYFVYVLAYDTYRREKLTDLGKILFWSILFSTWLSVLFSYLFARKAITPISDFISSVKLINSSSLGERLDEGDRSDEIEQLAVTFNSMLSNLEEAFRNQEEFISNASHELRTPISVMIAEADYMLGRVTDFPDYSIYLERLINDLRQMNSLLNNLLELAEINSTRQMEREIIRIDELIYQAIQEVKISYSDRKIQLSVNYPEPEEELLVNVNAGLILIALRNLMENACKFSDETIQVRIEIEQAHIKVLIIDHGIGIPENDLQSIFRPFRRAANAAYKGGFGIGLSLVHRIMTLHDVNMHIDTQMDQGTRIILIFTRVITQII